MSTNPITGDKLISKVNTKEYDENYDLIFKTPKQEPKKEEKPKYNFKETTDD